MNLFGYANQNSLRYIDSSGNNSLLISAAGFIPEAAIFGGIIIGNAIHQLCSAANDNTPPEFEPEKKCPFVRELPESVATPGNRGCIYQCRAGLRLQEYSRAFGACKPFILPTEGQPYTPVRPIQ